MLTKNVIHYYSIIRKKFEKSYLAEDANQIIIGIDCDYVDSYEYNYKTLELFYNNQKSIAPFAGLFGVFPMKLYIFLKKLRKKRKVSLNFHSLFLPMRRHICIIQKSVKHTLFMETRKNITLFLKNTLYMRKTLKKNYSIK